MASKGDALRSKNAERMTAVMWGSFAVIGLCAAPMIWLSDPALTKGMLIGGPGSGAVTAIGALLAATCVPVLTSPRTSPAWRRVLRFVTRVTAVIVGVIGLDSALTSSRGPWILALFGALSMYMVAQSRVASPTATYRETPSD
jgi:hypothetical protein